MQADTAKRATAERDRANLITEASRLAFEIEAAERNAPHDAHGTHMPRLRLRYHNAMARLLALTEAFDPAAQNRIDQARQDHDELAARYERELAQLEGQGA